MGDNYFIVSCMVNIRKYKRQKIADKYDKIYNKSGADKANKYLRKISDEEHDIQHGK